MNDMNSRNVILAVKMAFAYITDMDTDAWKMLRNEKCSSIVVS